MDNLRISVTKHEEVGSQKRLALPPANTSTEVENAEPPPPPPHVHTSYLT